MSVLTPAILAVNTVLLGWLATVGWKNRERPSAGLFAALQTVSMLWAGLTLVSLFVAHGSLRIGLWGTVTALSLLSAGLWLAFIIQYTGRDRWIHSWLFRVATVPLVAGAVLYTVSPTWSPLVGELTQSTIPAGTVVLSSIGPVGALLGVYIYAVFAAGLVLVGKTVLERNRLFVGQALALAGGTLVTVLGSVGAIIGVPVEGFPITQVALGPQSILWGYAVFREQFLTQIPAVARIGERAVLRDLDDGVVVIGDETVVQANPRACDYLGRDSLVGTPRAELFAVFDVDDFAEFPVRFQRRGRTYQVKTSPVSNWHGVEIGQSLVIQDVTTLVRRQERLQVLNRILRHNLRNDLTVILGTAHQIESQSESEIAKLGETVEQRARGLSEISEKALEVEQMFERESKAVSVDLDALVCDIVDDLATDHPKADIEKSMAAGKIETDPKIVRVVVREIVENALVHGGAAPVVTVSSARQGEEVEVTVADDGPGIPDSEIEPVKSGTETPLNHASSLGVWLISWGARALGGTVSFTTDDGSTVRFSIPTTSRVGAESVPVASADSD
ncbi:histidine kinase N-terminal 7TM domain-containing protein [Salinibaculum rarum]|uniref:histidine kinase N-terminal 7TM domain-containing protein n=1 Tax=Salinibaculum rarum TaxID=3058903 RepID=UPI00265DC8B2|nr:histidine kinase N-terminal 7TM domain-containing protein [Salinibaculum sp. KK48]